MNRKTIPTLPLYHIKIERERRTRFMPIVFHSFVYLSRMNDQF